MSKSKSNPKIFVMDTNVILHDSDCIYQFKDNDIAIPIAVIEELDDFKKGNLEINYHARRFIRFLDEKQVEGGDAIFKEGVSIGDGLGKIRILLAEGFHEDIEKKFPLLDHSKPDYHILNSAYNLQLKYPNRDVVLVSKDINVRLKARVFMMAEDYTTDRVDDNYTGKRLIKGLPGELIDMLHDAEGNVEFSELIPYLGEEKNLFPNQFLILQNGVDSQSTLAWYDAQYNLIHRITNPTKSSKGNVCGIQSRNAEQRFAVEALLNPELHLVTITGKAGTGKTLLAVAAALALESQKRYDKMLVARPIVPLSNKDIGYLPGDIQSKIGPYMKPLYDSLDVVKNNFSQTSTDSNFYKIQKMLEDGTIEIAPLSHIRGRSLPGVFFIIDEAQNLTPHEVKTIVTRAGEGAKIVFTGDIDQIDHPYLDKYSNGLSYLIHKMKNQKIAAHITLEKGERSELANIAGQIL